MVFGDGSCTTPPLRDLRRAGWSLSCNLPGLGQIVNVHGPVWSSMPQTPQSAEHAALGALAQLACCSTVFVGDCLGVIRAASAGQASLRPGLVHAGTLRQAAAAPAAGYIKAAIHTKAHRELSEAKGGLDRYAILANEAVDELAKAGNLLHPDISAAVVEAEEVTAFVKEVLGHASRALRLWPQPTGMPPRKARKEKPPPALPPPAERHAWARDRHTALWRCSRCCRVEANPCSRQPCRGAPRVLDRYRQDPKGHKLVALPAEGGGMVFMCHRCSGWSQGRHSVKLAKQCLAQDWDPRSRLAQQARTVVGRAARGIHPDPRSKARLLPTRAFEAAASLPD